MATLGEVTTALRNHEDRLVADDARLQGHEARHVSTEQRLAALESDLVAKLMGIIAGAGGGGTKDGLRIKDGKDNLPSDFMGDRKKFRGWSHQMYVWAIAIYPESGRKLLEDASKLKTEFDEDEDLDDILHPHGKKFSLKLYQVLSKTAKDDAMKYVASAGLGRGLRAWQSMAQWYDGREAGDKEAAYATVTNQTRAKTEDELQKKFMQFEKLIKDYEERFTDIQEEAKIVALKSMIPEDILGQRFRGKKMLTYKALRDELVAYMVDKPTAKGSSDAMDISLMMGKPPGIDEPSGSNGDEDALALQGGKGGGKGKDGGGKGMGGKDCFYCGKKGHFARECPDNPQAMGKGSPPRGQPYQKFDMTKGYGKGGYQQYPIYKNAQQKGDWGKGDWNMKGFQGKGWGGGGTNWGGGGANQGGGQWNRNRGVNAFENDDEEDGDLNMHEDHGHDFAVWSLQEEKKIVYETVDDSDDEEEHVPELDDSSDEEEEPFILVTNKKIKVQNRFAPLQEVGSLTLEPEEPQVMSVEEQKPKGGWKKVTVTVDSGSADHVAPEAEFSAFQLEESEGSKKGRRYVAANGQRVPNLGQRKVAMATEDGRGLHVVWQVTKVVKPLLSVSKLTSNGNVVILDKYHPRIIGVNGDVTWLRRINGTYECDLWVKEGKQKPNPIMGFARQ